MIPATKGTILIVDDQQENIRLAGNVLSQFHYNIITATCAGEAVEILSKKIPDLILLDVMMPETDGLTVCRQIKANAAWAEVPVIFLSTLDDRDLIVPALSVGGVDYVTKPFNKAELLGRVRTHLELKEARDHRRHLAEDKDEILGILAHDLKNAIAGIQLSSSLLAERLAELPPRCGSLVQNILETSTRMLANMTDFLANQRAEHMQIQCMPLELASVAAKVLAMNAEAARAKGISMLGVQGNGLASADHEALIQVLDNLVSNALKFTPPGGTVEVAIDESERGCHIRISDSGPGFSAGDRSRIFQRYQRLSARPTANEPSTGLGLSIASRLCGMMNGGLRLVDGQSRLGGAEFVIQLPSARTA